MIRVLPTTVPPPAEPFDEGVYGPAHPIRAVTRDIAVGEGGWEPERAREVAELFDRLAPEWHKRHTPERLAVVEDALERGGLGAGLCVELGSGAGQATRALADHFDRVLALDLSMEMLRQAPRDAASCVRADGARLPLRDRSVDALVLINMFLFPREVDRVLQPSGVLLWVSSRGDRTPIYLPPTEVAEALPGAWEGVTASASRGTWSVLRRASRGPGAGEGP